MTTASYYEGLPIYRAAMAIAMRVDAVAQRFAKRHEYTLGSRLRDMFMDVVMLVARCHRRADRARGLPVLCDRIEEMRVFLNLGKEVKAVTSVGEIADRLHLGVRSRPIALASAGVDFVGYVTRPGSPRRRVVEALRKELTAAEKLLAPLSVREPARLVLAWIGPVAGPVRAWCRDARATEALRGSWSSRDGHLVHASSHRLRERLWNAHPIARAVLARRGGRITRRFALIRPAASFAAQVAQLGRGISVLDDGRLAVLLVQVGRFVEAPRDGWRLGLRRHWAGRRRASGLPWRAAAWLIERGLARGYVVALALEEPEACGNVKRRQLPHLFERPISAQPKTKESP